MKIVLRSLFATFLLAPSALAQSVLTVDPSGANGAFLTPQLAVNAATDGDLILIKSGSNYQGVTIDGKGLTLVADSGATVILRGTIDVLDVPESSEVVLDGFEVAPLGMLIFAGVRVDNCDGHVLLQNLNVTMSGPAISLAGPLSVFNSNAVTLVDTVLDAGPGQVSVSSGTSVIATDSNVYVHGSTLLGATGVPGDFFGAPGQPGSPAFALQGGTALIVDSTLTGGRGGVGGNLPLGAVTDGGDGGAAVQMTAGADAPSFVVYGSTLTGGAGGSALSPASPGNAGPPIDLQAGTVTTPTSIARTFLVESVVRDGELSTLQFSGQPFDLVFHVIGLATDNNIAYSPAFLGAIHPGGTPLFIKFRGLLNAAGTKSLSGVLGPTGLGFVGIYEQAVMFNQTEGFVASNPRYVTFLDSQIP